MSSHFYAIRAAIAQVGKGARSYLEVGVNEGTSLQVAVTECPTIQELVLIDQWGYDYGGTGRGSHDHIPSMLSEWGYTGKVEFIDGDSHVILRSLAAEGRLFDLVTIDGDHSELGGEQDLNDGWKLVRPGGWIVFDDITHVAHPYLMDVAVRFATVQQPANTLWVTNLANGAVAFQKPNQLL